MAYNNVKVKARQTVAQSNTQTKDLGIVSEVPMGEWNNTTPYRKLNLVRYNGATYIATQDNQDATPSGSGIWLLVNKDGRGVQATTIAYQASVSGTTPPTGEWVSDVPTVPQGQYLWTRVIYAFTDETQTIAYSVSLQGLNFTQQDRDDIDRITAAIPSTASADNPLATHAFVNSSINAMAAFYITYNAAGNAFPTKASLTGATTFYNGGKARIPTQNDYATVLADESQTQNADGTYPTTRYVYQGGTYPNGQWELSFIVNSTTFTQAQLDALNSGISQQKIASMDAATAEKYTKPSTGIPESDLSDAVKTKLNKEGGVSSVNGKTGDVKLDAEGVGAMPISGGQFTGKVSFSGSAAVDDEGALPYFLGIKPFADGGTIIYRSRSHILKELGGVSRSGDTMTGILIVPEEVIRGGTSNSTGHSSANPKLRFSNIDGSQEISLVYTDYDEQGAPASLSVTGNQGNEIFRAPILKEGNERVFSPNNLPTAVKDASDGKAITFVRNSAISTTSWLAAWNGYELRPISPDNVRVVIDAVNKAGDTMTGALQVNAPIFGYNYSRVGSSAAFLLDKPGSNYSGVGAHETADTIYFGACSKDGVWNDSYKQIWQFNGNMKADAFYDSSGNQCYSESNLSFSTSGTTLTITKT